MRKNIFILLVASLSVYIKASAQQIVDLSTCTISNGIEESIPTREVEKVSDGVVVTYSFSKVIMQNDPLYDGSVFYKINGFGMNDVSSEASYPIRIDKITVPMGKSFSIKIEESSYVDIDGEMSPARQPLTDSGNDSYTKENVLPISAYTGLMPNEIVEESGMQTYRGYTLLDVKVCPIQYDYENKKVRIYKNIKYKVSFLDAQSDGETLSIDTANNNTYENFLDNTTLNGNVSDNMRKAKSINNNIAQEYLIISTPEFKDAVNKFAEWKKLMGMNVHVVLRSDWTSDIIKSTASDMYSKYGIRYLLIVGDQDDVPGKSSTFKTWQGTYNYVTDLYYGCVDGDTDYTPDIYRGRLSVSTLEEAKTVVDKIINYEKSPIQNANFYKKGVNCAYFQDDNCDTYADRRFAQTSEDVRNYLVSKGKSIERIYYAESYVTPKYWNNTYYSYGEEIPAELQKPQFAWKGGASDISSAINQGAFYVLHRDHGNTEGWGSPSFKSANAASLTNGNKLPVVFSMNCQTGKYNSGTCFTEHFLRNANGGCVAIYGATETSFSGYNDALTEGMFDAIWPSPGLRPVFPNVSSTGGTTPTPTYRLGQILDQGMERMEETYGKQSSGNSKYTREIFHCFGDPSMQIPTEVPSAFSNVSVTRNNGKVTVSIAEVAERVTFYDMLTNEVCCYSGSTASIKTKNPQYVTVCVSGHNKIPYVNYGKEPSVVYIQNETINNSRNFSGDYIKVGSSVTDTKEEGPVYVNSGTTNIEGTVISIYPETTISNKAKLKLSIKK